MPLTATIDANSRERFKAAQNGVRIAPPPLKRTATADELFSVPKLAESLAQMLHEDIKSGAFILGE